MATPRRFPPVKSPRPRTPRSMSGNLEDGVITMRRSSGRVKVINYDNMLEEAKNAKVDPLNLKSWSTFLMNNKVQSKLLLTLSALGAAAYWYLSKSSPESPPMLALPSPDMVAKQQLLDAFRQVWYGFKATKKSVKKSPKKSVKKSVKKSRKAKKSAKKSLKKQ